MTGDPVWKKRLRAAMRRAWADPEKRARMHAGQLAAQAARACPAEMRPYYAKLRRAGFSREVAMAAVREAK